ncbi:putative oxidoreductase [Chionoecetes opilio]|uniref:Putative oxidoreductase n=1 Tax=Chionoecetes opilio TaxID=41210 RepID=A0A8J4XQT7_CHIOP|nr:putative oxidoreductase [Chionoecetes opilio]
MKPVRWISTPREIDVFGTSHDGGYSHDAVVYALKDCGYRHIDTAKRYGCERYIAQAVKASGVPRQEVFLATKCWPTDYGATTTREAFSGSCQRLAVDYLDMYLLHWPEVSSGVKDKKKLLQETWRTLEVLLDEERVKAIGVSNFLERHLEIILEECSVTPHVNQCEFHPFNNPKMLRQFCADRNIQFEGYSPLAKGLALRDPGVVAIAEAHGRSPAQVLVRWSVQSNVPSIPKSTKLECVRANSQVYDFILTQEEMMTLNSMTQTLTCVDRNSMQMKIDNPLPDGYKLKLVKPPPEP